MRMKKLKTRMKMKMMIQQKMSSDLMPVIFMILIMPLTIPLLKINCPHQQLLNNVDHCTVCTQVLQDICKAVKKNKKIVIKVINL